MGIKEIEAKTLLIQRKRIDSWFISRYSMNLYRGCEHNCAYCDGRAEKYQVEGDFAQDVSVKINVLELLQRELDPSRKRLPFKPGFIFVGGGVGDSYQPAETTYQLTRNALGLIKTQPFAVHLLTKSTLIERDIDILSGINAKKRALVSFSFSSTDDKISSLFEPSASLPSRKLQAIKRLKEAGLTCGVYLMPVIPFITDTPAVLQKSLEDFAAAHVDFVIFGGMTLKVGRQKDFFYSLLRKEYTHLIAKYDAIYPGDPWGQARHEYYQSIEKTFHELIRKYRIPKRIPQKYFADILDTNDKVIVTLEHIDYYLKSLGRSSPFGYAAYSISNIKEPLELWQEKLQTIKGVGPTTEKMIREIMESGVSSYYERLLKYEDK
jgi:DNA repair photolyase